jgi:NADPH-dependent ferric siderophore reductase
MSIFGFLPVKPRKPRYRVTVKRVVDLAPRMRRVTFTGEALSAFIWSGPAAHIKLVFAPQAGADQKPVLRTYTPRRFDPQTLELDVDLVLHGEGPASRWAEQAAPGQWLEVAGPGRGYAVDPGAGAYLLAGDETAIPALATILADLPEQMPVQVFVEVSELGQSAALDSTHPGARIHWLVRDAHGAAPGTLLEAAVRGCMLAETTRVYVGCEAAALRRMRRYLLLERQLPATQVTTRGYWKLGETDHPDRDFGEDA